MVCVSAKSPLHFTALGAGKYLYFLLRSAYKFRYKKLFKLKLRRGLVVFSFISLHYFADVSYCIREESLPVKSAVNWLVREAERGFFFLLVLSLPMCSELLCASFCLFVKWL